MKCLSFFIFITIIIQCNNQLINDIVFIEEDSFFNKNLHCVDSLNTKKITPSWISFFSDFSNDIVNEESQNSFDSILNVRGVLDTEPSYKIIGNKRALIFDKFLKEGLYEFNNDSTISKTNLNCYFIKTYSNSSETNLRTFSMDFVLKQGSWKLETIFVSNSILNDDLLKE